MSFSKSKRDAIKHYLLEKISEDDTAAVKKTAETFSISLNTEFLIKTARALQRPDGGSEYFYP